MCSVGIPGGQVSTSDKRLSEQQSLPQPYTQFISYRLRSGGYSPLDYLSSNHPRCRLLSTVSHFTRYFEITHLEGVAQILLYIPFILQ